jgi:excisionase family DNA binding protein
MRASDEAPYGADAVDRDRIAYTLEDTARLLSISIRKVKYMVDSGELPSIKVGRARRVHGTAIEDYARRQATPGAREAS